MPEPSKNPVAFITGAASGIGLGMARAFARAGMKVAMADRDAVALAAAAEQVRALGAAVMSLDLDVSDWAQWDGVPERVEAALGPVNILCNNAGISLGEQKLEETVVSDWQRIFAINVDGVMHGLKAFASRMDAATGGHIVNTSSAGGLSGVGHLGLPGRGAYVATKFAVVGLSEVLRTEMALRNIGVSVLCPGPVATELLRKAGRERGGVMPAEALDPDHIGQAVLDAIRANRLYVLTHASRRVPVKRRHAEIEAGFDALERADAQRAAQAAVSLNA